MTHWSATLTQRCRRHPGCRAAAGLLAIRLLLHSQANHLWNAAPPNAVGASQAAEINVPSLIRLHYNKNSCPMKSYFRHGFVMSFFNSGLSYSGIHTVRQW